MPHRTCPKHPRSMSYSRLASPTNRVIDILVKLPRHSGEEEKRVVKAETMGGRLGQWLDYLIMRRLDLVRMMGEGFVLWCQRSRAESYCRTITPIRVSHDLTLQVFYSVEGESVAGATIEGPGELRLMAVRLNVLVPSVGVL
jgi:hypothetical protein